MATSHGSATASVATENTENRTQRTRSASKEAGAAAPSEESTNAGTVVAEYVKVRTAAGMFTAKPHRAILGRHVKAMLASGRWDGPTILAAIREFAATKRHPRFVAEWCSQYLTERELADHEARKREETVAAPRVDKPIAKPNFAAYLREALR